MKRTGYLGLSLFLLFALAASALPSFAQDKQPQAKTRPEYDAYLGFYNEKDPVKKAALGEKFITDFKESDYIPQAHIFIISAYTDAKNWGKVMESADRAVALPGADNKLKIFANANAMNAGQNSNNVDKVISYGDKLLALDPTNLAALVTVSGAIPVKLPTEDGPKKAALDKAEDLAKKGLAGVETMMAKADAATKAQLVPVQGNLHATLGLVAYDRVDYMKSIQEYEQAIQKTPKDDVSHFYMGLDYQALAAKASGEYMAAVDAENKAKAARAEQPIIDELSAKSSGLGGDVQMYRDKAMDALAVATAIGGPASGQAKDVLTKLWKTKNNDSTDGMEDFIANKRKQLQ